VKRKQVEESFAWIKTIALLRKVRHRGLGPVDWIFTFAAAAYNLIHTAQARGRSVSVFMKDDSGARNTLRALDEALQTHSETPLRTPTTSLRQLQPALGHCITTIVSKLLAR
jgi:hypothetical protein